MISEIPALTDAELTQLVSVDPTAEPTNPWHPKFDNTPRGQNIRRNFEMANPELAAGLKSKAPNVQLSAQALAYERGLAPLTEAVHNEMMEESITYRQQRQSRNEEGLKAAEEKMWADAQALAARNGNPDPRAAYEAQQAGTEMPNFGSGWQADARRRDWLYQQSMRQA